MACGPLLVAPLLWAQAAPVQDDELHMLLNTKVEVSNTVPTTVFRSPSTVTILDRDTLQRLGVQTLEEAVNLVAGVRTYRTLGYTDIATMRGVLQGAYMNRVLFLINGAETWDVLTGLTMLGRVPIQDVERVEILKGPASVLYGTNATSGAINVVLRRAGVSESQVRGQALARGGHRVGAHATLQLPGDLSLFLGTQDARIFGHTYAMQGEPLPQASEVVRETFTMAERREDRSGQLQVQWKGHALLVNLFDSHATSFGLAMRRAQGAGEPIHNQAQFIHYDLKQALGETLTLRGGTSRDTWYRIFPAAPNLTSANHCRGTRLTGSLGLAWQPRSDLNLDLSGSFQRVQSGATILNRRVDTGAERQDIALGHAIDETSALLQATWDRGPWTVFGGLRSTRNDHFGHNVSGRAALVRTFEGQQSLKLFWGQSFRAPAVFDQYVATPGVLMGSTHLRPETCDTVELAYLVSRGKLFVQSQVYHSNYRELLIRVAGPGGLQIINGGRFKGWGGEVEAKFQDTWGLAFLNLGYATGDDGDRTSGGHNFLHVPAWDLKAGLSGRRGPWTGALTLRWLSGATAPLSTSTRMGSSVVVTPYGTRIPGALTLDLSLQGTWPLGPKARLRPEFYVKNATNQDIWYVEMARRSVERIQEGLGRQVGLGVTLQF